jgi:hypothetical protein
MNKKNLFQYVKDHVEHFGFFPYDYEDFNTGETISYPEYLDLFIDKEKLKLSILVNNYGEK